MTMRFLTFTFTAALCIALAGCASSGGLHTTGTLTDARNLKTEQSLASVPLSATAWPTQDWWVSYGDPQLTALIDEALQDNPSLDVAQARARQAQAAADSVDAGRKPQVGLDAGMQGVRLSSKDPVYPEYALGTFAWAKSATVDFSWDLDLWGGKRAAWEAALGRSRAAQIDAYAARIQLSVNVARAYVQLGYAFAQQDVADAEVQRTSKSAALTRRLIAGGLGKPQQAYLADSQVASAEQQKAQADRAIDAARSSLSVLVGQGPDRGRSITRPHLLDTGTATLPDRLSVDLIGRRADLVAARWQVEAAGKDIKAAKTQFLPNISLGAMAGFVAVGGSTSLFQLPARTYSVAPALSLPIFDGGRLRANLVARDAGYDEAVAHYNSLLIGAVNDVSDLVSATASIRTQIALEKRAKDDAQRSFDDSLKLLSGGLSDSLTPLVTRQQLLLAEQRLAALESEQADISIRLVDALGGGYAADVPVYSNDHTTRKAADSSPVSDAIATVH
jgi:NodT family efflux transporter outer membrane factor (OMF) lipoprotein